MAQVLNDLSQFAGDVVRGLTSTPKSLPSKYFYDANGDHLFQMIMTLPEYYLTRAEYEIFKFQCSKIIRTIASDEPLQLIELGAGDGLKTKLLLKELYKQNINFQYYPIDISANALDILSGSVEKDFKDISIHPIEGEYFKALASPQLHAKSKKLILFLGSTIGNFPTYEASNFIGCISESMTTGDNLLIGFDLKKHPETILNAYNDRQGITRDFNLNLLKRINRELGANFALDQFTHFPIYDPVQAAAKSFLVSMREQEVYIAAAKQRVFFKAYESIFMEISQKFDHDMIQQFASNNGLKINQTFTDSRSMFADVMFEKS
ncbi:MAG TPA: L-histidine N(alpha)-methyltransferase [Flavipsychrobacter sp.]|nr:L-histidine N(alpha)-methyltransferase [Flavipsychrobacter sp.]